MGYKGKNGGQGERGAKNIPQRICLSSNRLYSMTPIPRKDSNTTQSFWKSAKQDQQGFCWFHYHPFILFGAIWTKCSLYLDLIFPPVNQILVFISNEKKSDSIPTASPTGSEWNASKSKDPWWLSLFSSTSEETKSRTSTNPKFLFFFFFLALGDVVPCTHLYIHLAVRRPLQAHQEDGVPLVPKFINCLV